MESLGGALATLLVVCVALLGFSPRRALPGSSLSMLRSLLPSWRFFESPEVSFLLLARPLENEQDTSPFSPVIPKPKPSAAGLLFAPRRNLALACHGLVERLAGELAEQGAVPMEEAERWVSYRRVQAMACFYLAQRAPGFQRYQLQLSYELPSGEPGEVLFVSPVYTRGAL